MIKDSTTDLDTVLKDTSPENIDDFFNVHAESVVWEERPFAAYMRALLKEKGLRQQDVFLKADLSQRYGYRLLSQEKHTTQRDYILRICFAAGFSLKETDRALKLYGMSELYSRIPRDAVLMIAFNRGISEIEQVNELLLAHGMEPLAASALPE